MPRPGILEETAVAAAKETFTMEVKLQRVRCNMSQKQLAEFANVDQASMSRLLRNPDKLSVGRLRSIIHALGIQPAVILRLLGYTDAGIKQSHYEHDHLEYALSHMAASVPTMQMLDARSHREYTKDSRGGEV